MNINGGKIIIILYILFVLASVGDPPTVQFCPRNQHHVLSGHAETAQVSWTEPHFGDNVNVTSITKTNVSSVVFNIFFLPFFINANISE